MRAVIFDCDGTLVDSEPLARTAWERALAVHGYALTDADAEASVGLPYPRVHAYYAERVELPAAEECCGFGGTFAVKNAETSVSMGSDKVRHARDTGAEVLVAGDNSCLMHLGGLLSREQAGMRVMHLAEVLASTEAS